MDTHAVELPGGHVLNRFYSDAKRPRPESYREDMHAVKEMTEDQSQSFFSDVIAVLNQEKTLPLDGLLLVQICVQLQLDRSFLLD